MSAKQTVRQYRMELANVVFNNLKAGGNSEDQLQLNSGHTREFFECLQTLIIEDAIQTIQNLKPAVRPQTIESPKVEYVDMATTGASGKFNQKYMTIENIKRAVEEINQDEIAVPIIAEHIVEYYVSDEQKRNAARNKKNLVSIAKNKLNTWIKEFRNNPENKCSSMVKFMKNHVEYIPPYLPCKGAKGAYIFKR